MKTETLGAPKLDLVGAGPLQIVFLGVGSAFAETLNQTNFLILKNGRHILVDFGMTGPAALKQVGLKPTDIGVVLPTHSHADHVGGIECLALMNRYVGQRFMGKNKLNMIITEEYQRILWDRTLRGGLEDNENPEGRGQKLHFVDFFDVIRPTWKTHQPREVYEIDFFDIHLELFRTMHIPEQSKTWEESFVSFGLYIDNRVFISCDTRFDPQLIELYRDAEVMFHDVQFFPGAVHAPLNDLRRFTAEIKQKMYLIHYADNWREQNIEGFAGFAEERLRYIFE